MQQAGPLPKGRKFHCGEQDGGGEEWGWGEGSELWVAQSAKDEGYGQMRPGDSGIGQDAGGRGLFILFLNLILEIQAQSTLSDAHIWSSQRKVSHKASFKNRHAVKDDSAAFRCLVKREYISVPPMAPLTTHSDAKQNDDLLVI